MNTKFDTASLGEHLMTVNGCKVGLNMPDAVKSVGSKDNETVCALPPHRRRKAYLVDKYPACPANWLRSSGRIKSYFVPVVEGAGLWLDFNSCLVDIPQHVAAVVSVQGINAISGLPVQDAALEQYIDTCPKHEKPFGADRLCKECGFKWPKQNYLSSAGTPTGNYWLDGFRTADGAVRQYLMTAKAERGVAKAIIGNDRVFSLGISFFLTKEKRPTTPPADVRGQLGGQIQTSGYMQVPSGWPKDYVMMPDDKVNHDYEIDQEQSDPFYPKGPWCDNTRKYRCAPNSDSDQRYKVAMTTGHAPEYLFSTATHASLNSFGCSDMVAMNSCVTEGSLRAATPIPVKSMEVAAGAKLPQRIWDDPNGLEAYESKPTGLIVISYCTEDECESILAVGEVDVEGAKDGFLAALPVGN